MEHHGAKTRRQPGWLKKHTVCLAFLVKLLHISFIYIYVIIIASTPHPVTLAIKVYTDCLLKNVIFLVVGDCCWVGGGVDLSIYLYIYIIYICNEPCHRPPVKDHREKTVKFDRPTTVEHGSIKKTVRKESSLGMSWNLWFYLPCWMEDQSTIKIPPCNIPQFQVEY